MDASMPMPDDSSDKGISSDMDFPVKLDSLQVDGIRPKVDDTVTVKVEGSITRIVDDCAYVQPEKVNGTPVEELKHQMPEADDESRLEQLSAQADMAGTAPGGPGYS
jgi:hypothetical protein